jgi:hypothetical protein
MASRYTYLKRISFRLNTNNSLQTTQLAEYSDGPHVTLQPNNDIRCIREKGILQLNKENTKLKHLVK